MKVSVLGLWHLGSVTSACLANYGYNVTGYDKDQLVVKNLNNGHAPISEPGLDSLIEKNINDNTLKYTNNLQEAVENSDFVLLTIDTPVDEDDNVDLSPIFDIIDKIADFVKDGTTIIIESQVPVGTCNDVANRIKKKFPNLRFNLAYCPENLRLGKAIEIFQNPDRIIIGADDEQTKEQVRLFFDIIDCPKIIMDLKSAEMTKHAINSFLATCISFINLIGNVCEEIDADAVKVSEGLMTEKRIGKNLPLKPGSGFSGGTLGRDLKVLINLGKKIGINPYILESVIETNREQNMIALRKLLKIFKNLENITVGILGLTYKPGTNTLRRSNSIELIKELNKLKTNVKAFDPAISEENFTEDKKFMLCDNFYAVAENADVLIIMTDWPEFKKIDYNQIFKDMKNPVIIDTKNFLDQNQLKEIGFQYVGIGLRS